MGAKIEVVSWSQIDTGRQCPHKHELAYIERWQQPTVAGSALSKGILWHELMDVHYGFIRDQQAAGVKFFANDDKIRAYLIDHGWEGWIKEHPIGKQMWPAVRALLYSPQDGSQTPDQELILWMYQGYLSHWGLDQHWRILAVEHGVEYPLYLPTGRKSRFRLKTKIDLIVEEAFRGRGRLILVDHKSGRNLPKHKDFALMDQFGLYEDSLRRVGRRPFGTVHSAARTHKNVDQKKNPQPLPERFERNYMARTDTELEAIAAEALRDLQTLYRYKPGEAPRHPSDDTCGWKCNFTEACLAGRRGMDEREILARSGFQINKERH